MRRPDQHRPIIPPDPRLSHPPHTGRIAPYRKITTRARKGLGENVDNKLISKTVIAGLVIAAAAIGLFFILWLALASLEPFLRLFLSVCVPPALMAGVIGVYILSTRHRVAEAPVDMPTDEPQP